MTETTNTDIQTKVEELVTEDLTPYKLAKVVSQMVGREVRPQQLYNYVSNRLIPATKVDGKVVVKRDDAIAWVVKYTTKHTAK